MVIIGGFGSWVGALIGAIVLGYLPLRLTSLGEWWPVIYGGVMMLVATYLPGRVLRARPPSHHRDTRERAPLAAARGRAVGDGCQSRAADR